jgi:hypothetical protein
MKRFITAAIIVIAIALFSAFMPGTNEIRKNAADVEQKEGLYIFMLSKPQCEYEYLGSEKKVLSWSGKPEEMLNSMIRKVKKEYPKAEGLIFTNISMDKCDVIAFKDKKE